TEQAISRKEAEAARLEGIVARNRGRPDPRGYISGFAQRAEQLRSDVLYLRGRIEVLEAQDNGGLLGGSPLPNDTTLDPPANANTDDGRDREAEQRLKRQQDFLASLEAENEQRRFAIEMIDQEARERQILEAIREKELAAQDVGLKL